MTRKYLRLLGLAALLFGLPACASFLEREGWAGVDRSPGLPPFPPARFAVFSDPHLHTPSLGMTGKAFWESVDQGKKLLQLSEEILTSVIDELAADKKIDFVLVPGDLTKDGEKENHLRIASLLAKLEAAGKKVYVVPGNHDVRNFAARRYTEQGSRQTPSVDAAEFAALYAEFGYREALSRDAHSLSYAAEPVPGLRLLGIDACVYENNSPSLPTVTGGRLQKETLAWIMRELETAYAAGKAVIGFMHHGLLEHFAGQKKYFSDYVVDEHERLSRLLAAAGLRFMFTGHFHAQDVVLARFPEKSFLFDIETSSLVTYPSAFRLLEFSSDEKLFISSHPVSALPSMPNFQAYARQTLVKGVEKFFTDYLRRFEFSPDELKLLVPQVVRALLAHTAGDEETPSALLDYTGFSLKLHLFVGAAQDLLAGVWHDLPPADNDLIIDCRSGAWEKAPAAR